MCKWNKPYYNNTKFTNKSLFSVQRLEKCNSHFFIQRIITGHWENYTWYLFWRGFRQMLASRRIKKFFFRLSLSWSSLSLAFRTSLIVCTNMAFVFSLTALAREKYLFFESAEGGHEKKIFLFTTLASLNVPEALIFTEG